MNKTIEYLRGITAEYINSRKVRICAGIVAISLTGAYMFSQPIKDIGFILNNHKLISRQFSRIPESKQNTERRGYKQGGLTWVVDREGYNIVLKPGAISAPYKIRDGVTLDKDLNACVNDTTLEAEVGTDGSLNIKKYGQGRKFKIAMYLPNPAKECSWQATFQYLPRPDSLGAAIASNVVSYKPGNSRYLLKVIDKDDNIIAAGTVSDEDINRPIRIIPEEIEKITGRTK